MSSLFKRALGELQQDWRERFGDREYIILVCLTCRRVEVQKTPYLLPYCICSEVLDGAGSLQVSEMAALEDEAAHSAYLLGGTEAVQELVNAKQEAEVEELE